MERFFFSSYFSTWFISIYRSEGFCLSFQLWLSNANLINDQPIQEVNISAFDMNNIIYQANGVGNDHIKNGIHFSSRWFWAVAATLSFSIWNLPSDEVFIVVKTIEWNEKGSEPNKLV